MTEIHLHPLVLLSIADHHRRANGQAVVGALMGTVDEDIHIKNSFAVPYQKNKFLDTSYLQDMLDLHRKVDMDKFIGWYHTGNDFKDIEISSHQLETAPLLLMLDFENIKDELPVKLFKLVDGELVGLNFDIQAEEAEEVGVEHLLRGIRNTSVGFGHIKEIKSSLIEYESKIAQIVNNLQNINAEKLTPADRNLLNKCQDIINQIEDVNGDINESEMVRYVSTLIKAVVLMDDLVRKKLEFSCD